MITLRNIRKSYKMGDFETEVLHGITMDINDGEFVAIMGPSGSGKSTLMNILGLLDTPTSGEYVLDGKDVSRLTDNEQASFRADKIGFVFQSFNLLPRASVLRNVMLPLAYKTVKLSIPDRERQAAKALNAAAIPEEKWHNLSNQLSGGQIQRVAIARALVNDPSLILADEPTGNLDTKTSEQILSTLKELNKTLGRTIVLITHELDVAKHADRVVHIRDGLIANA